MDANDRVRTIRRVGSLAVGVALVISAPWIGWWTLILFAASALNFAIVDRLIRKSPHPERVSATAIVITMLMIGAGVVSAAARTAQRCPGWCCPRGWSRRAFVPQVVIAALVLTIAIIARGHDRRAPELGARRPRAGDRRRSRCWRG